MLPDSRECKCATHFEMEKTQLFVEDLQRFFFDHHNFLKNAHIKRCDSSKEMNKQMLYINNQEEEDTEKWVNYSYSSFHQILLVGEGDFSFSLSLAQNLGSASNIVATSLDSYGSLTKKYKKARSNLFKLQKLGAFLLHEVNATKMKLHTDLKMRKFDRIIFNFPHAGFHGREDNPLLIKKHRRLVHDFFHNARGMLRLNGEIHVNHKTSAPFYNWNLEELASQNSLVLFDRVPFRIENYPGYNNKRGDSWRCDEPFPLGECSTFKFIFSPGSRDGHRLGWHASGLGMERHDTQSYGLGVCQGQDVLNLVRLALCARQPTFWDENMASQTWNVPTQNTEHPVPPYFPAQARPEFPTQNTAHLAPPYRPVQTLPGVPTQNAAHPTPPYRFAQTRLDVPTQITAHPVTHYSLSHIQPDSPTRNTAHPDAHYSPSHIRPDSPTRNTAHPAAHYRLSQTRSDVPTQNPAHPLPRDRPTQTRPAAGTAWLCPPLPGSKMLRNWTVPQEQNLAGTTVGSLFRDSPRFFSGYFSCGGDIRASLSKNSKSKAKLG